jgi:hypothetical protein
MIVVEMKMGEKDFVRGNDVMAMEEMEVDAAEDGGYGQGEEEDVAAFAFLVEGRSCFIAVWRRRAYHLLRGIVILFAL